MDRYVVFADIVNKANRANGKVKAWLKSDIQFLIFSTFNTNNY